MNTFENTLKKEKCDLQDNPDNTTTATTPETTIEKWMCLSKSNKIILYEYFIGVFLTLIWWFGGEIKLAIFSYNLAKKHDFKLHGLTQSFTYFSSFRDFSDYQWRYFRSNFFFISSFAVIFLIMSHWIKRKYSQYHKYFYLSIGIIFSYYLHGNKIIFLYISVSLTYSLCWFYSYFGSVLFTFLTWTLCISIKILSEIYNGFSINSILSTLGLGSIFHVNENDIMGWNMSFGLIMLKIISFNIEFKNEMSKQSLKTNHMDTAWKIKAHCVECAQDNYCLTCLKFVKCDWSNYTYMNLLIYIFYPPLYLAGPTVLFNSFMFQWNNYASSRHNTLFTKEKLKYFILYIFDFLCFEVFNHFIYINCYLTNPYNKEIISEFNYFYLAMMTFNNLTFLWFKFLVIWRTSRCWSWFDGIYTEENMNRCVYNNYNFEEFWRAWHRSFNVWLIRYIYVPLGGKGKKVINMWVVFSFVALWHDLKLNLLIWGWFICLCFVPEIIVKEYFSKEKFNYLHDKIWFRLIKYLFSTIYVGLMIIANWIGFGMGSEGLTEIVMRLFEMTSWLMVVKIILYCIPMVIVMFYVRDLERKRYGNTLKY